MVCTMVCTTKDLEKKINELEKRLRVLENERFLGAESKILIAQAEKEALYV